MPTIRPLLAALACASPIALAAQKNHYALYLMCFYGDSGQEAWLKEIKQRAKQLIWLNPENKMTWGFGDSEMDRYLPHCDVVEECRNLNQLYKVIDRLVLV